MAQTPAEQYAEAVKALQEAQGKLPGDSIQIEQSSPFIEGLLQAYGPQLATNLATPVMTTGGTNQYGQTYGSFLPQAQAQNPLQQQAIQQMLTQQGYGTAQFGPQGQFTGIQGATTANPYGTGGTGIAGYQQFLDQAASDLGQASAAAAAGQGAGAAALGQAGTAFDAAQQAAVAGQGAGANFMGPNAYQQFMGGFTQDVIDPTLQQFDQDAAEAQAQLGLQATQAGAFGGSRLGVESAQLGAQSNLDKAMLQANLLLQGQQSAQQQANVAFGQAGQMAAQDVNMLGQAGQAQQQLASGLQGQAGQNVGLFGQTGQAQQGLASLQPTLSAGAFGSLGQFGTQQQQQGQAILDTTAQGNQMTAMQPQQGLGFFGNQLTGLLGGYQTPNTFTSLPPQQSASPMSMLLSGIGAAAPIGQMFGGWGSPGGTPT